MAAVIDRMSALVPPTDIIEWHYASLTSFEIIKAAVDQFPKDNEIELITLLALAEVSEAEDAKIREVVENLPDDIQLRLVDAGCADETAAAQDDHGNDFESATVLPLGEVVEGSLDSHDDTDAFVIQAQAGWEYTVELPYRFFIALGTKSGPLIRIYDSSGQEVARSEDDSETEVTWRADAGGNYYVVLGDGASQGDYTLTVTPPAEAPEVVPTAAPAPVGDDDHSDSIADATAMTVGEAVEGLLDDGGDQDFFVFEAQGGVFYQLDVELGTLEDSWLALFDSDELELAYNDDHGGSFASRIVWRAPGSGPYYVDVGGFGTGSYTLTVTATDIVDDHANSISGATAMTVGQAVEGNVNYDGDEDYFVFEAQEGVTYQVGCGTGYAGRLVVGSV